MTPPTLTFRGRLPGVDCSPALPPAEQPIRLDVAALRRVRRARAGRHAGAVEDAPQYAAVFGGDLRAGQDGGPAGVRAAPDGGRGVLRQRRAALLRRPGGRPGRRRPRGGRCPGSQIWQPDGAVSRRRGRGRLAGRLVGRTGGLRPLPIARPLAAAADVPAGREPLPAGCGSAAARLPRSAAGRPARARSRRLGRRALRAGRARVADGTVPPTPSSPTRPAGSTARRPERRRRTRTASRRCRRARSGSVRLLRLDLVVAATGPRASCSWSSGSPT